MVNFCASALAHLIAFTMLSSQFCVSCGSSVVGDGVVLGMLFIS